MTITAVAYRGEHGPKREDPGFQSRLASLSFGSLETAKTYAMSPNNTNDTVVNPRLYKVALTIDNPVMNDAHDPFIDFSVIRQAVGDDKAFQMGLELEEQLLNTDNFLELLEENACSTFTQLHGELGNELLDNLYVDAYPVFDNKTYVDWFREAGFDGAVHGGNGVSAMEAEYKVFDAKNVRVLRTIELGKSISAELVI